ncbi:MAG: sigma 54-interacting transcriptional regulator [Sphaerochaetaceae bacterium]|jgi:DNA-binding NtrC family response regulator|nr:sigma 54-interacting transcriptional regulator [Sphaerochaetaceae bacterium]MDX9808950.1 sigma 54-interacting transcriptional regulator [Sphaerochaetaceae bacterium]
MAIYLITKDLRMRALINRSLAVSVFCAINREQFDKLVVPLGKDMCPVLIIDSDYVKEHVSRLLCSLAFKGIKCPKILLVSHPSDFSQKEKISREHNILYLTKPFDQALLWNAIVEVAGNRPLEQHLDEDVFKSFVCSSSDPFDSIFIGTSKAARTVRTIIRRISHTFETVHIFGETGTGKEIVANLLFKSSGSRIPMVTVNCAILNGPLQDSTLFGHTKGAFTDARETRPGLLSKANGGVLFLDEIELLPYELQGKMLRILENGQYRALGSDELITTRFKLITASNIPLELLMKKGTIRSDFFNRIDRLSIEIPPLRERSEDIMPLAEHHLRQLGESRQFDRETIDLLTSYHWPGNVRELFNEIESIVLFSRGRRDLSIHSVLTSSHIRRWRASGLSKNLHETVENVAETPTGYSLQTLRETCG